MSSTALDVILLVLLVSFAAAGYRRGLVGTLASALGFVLGGWFVLWLLPGHLDSLLPRATMGIRALVLLGGVLFGAALGQRLAGRIIAPVSRRARHSAGGGLDAAAGGLLTLAVAGSTLWFTAGLLRSSAPSGVAAPIAGSRVVAVLDGVVPSRSDRVLSEVVAALDSAGFPRVFASSAAEPITPVPAPDSNIRQRSAITALSSSVVRIDSLAVACQSSMEGSGWVVRPGLVVTNAHVVAGAERVRVVSDGHRIGARVVAFDPDRDLAVLAVPELKAPALRQGGELGSGASAAVAGYPLAGPYRVDGARVRQVIQAVGKDIYGMDRVTREVYSLRAGIAPGNSGGPLVDTSGRVVGIVFARSLDDASTAYALTLNELEPVLSSVSADRRAVGTGECLHG